MRNPYRLLLATILFILPSFLGGLYAQKSIRLEYQLSTGQQYDYQIDIDQTIGFETNGQTMSLEQLMTFNTTAEVLYNSKDSINILTTIDKIQMNQKIFGMELMYNSDDTSTHVGMGAQIAEAMNPLINSDYTTSIDSRGNIIHMDFGKLVDNNDVAGSLNTANNFCNYADHKVKVGESWEADLSAMEGSEHKVHAKYTVKSISEKEVVLDFEGQLTGNNQGGKTTNLSGTQIGEITVDKKTGWVLKSSIEQNIHMEVEKDGEKFPATISGTVSLISAEK